MNDDLSVNKNNRIVLSLVINCQRHCDDVYNHTHSNRTCIYIKFVITVACLQVLSRLYYWESDAIHPVVHIDLHKLFSSCRSLRSIGRPFRGFLVWKCAFCSEWPAHWLHKFYSSWYDCQSHLADLGEKWTLNLAYETSLFMPVRFFYMP
jgi:hypothetical protein